MLCLGHTTNTPDCLNLKRFVHILSQLNQNLRAGTIPPRRNGLLHNNGNAFGVIQGNTVNVFMPVRQPYCKRFGLRSNALRFKPPLHRFQKPVGIVRQLHDDQGIDIQSAL